MGDKGERFIQSLRDNRNVWLFGKRVDVTNDPHFTGTLSTISALYDRNDDVQTAFLVPNSLADLEKRRAAFEAWSLATSGVMSRLSDYARSRLTGWYANREHYRQYDGQFPDKIQAFYEGAKREQRFLTVVQRDPQINRSADGSIAAEELGLLRITKKTSEGVRVSGAKMIGTSAPYSNDLIVYPLAKWGEEQKEQSSMLLVAADSPGLHMICREPFSSNAAGDHPLSARFDEMDALLIFDDVLVPWERVLLHENPDALWSIKNDKVSSGLAYHQAITRLQIKLEFAAAVANEIAETIGAAGYLHVQEKMGELLMQCQTIKALLIASEAGGQVDAYGTYIPDFSYIETARNLGAVYYPHALEVIQLIGAGGLIQTPSSVSDLHGDVSHLLQKYFKGAGTDAVTRTKLFKLAWDLTSSPLGSRHELYERYYAGDPIRNKAGQYLAHDKERWKTMVERYL
ncbi:4-hydroxyphenylacetate 3-hydroxylase family protein [Fictibacillus iocasae]|uniref:4-hydroxyphenylacetate 3-hydroxylase family protein n=1 Tax=Fictibacillus iocasae TaxID=2715437 RepID=A0ABW2NR29_9BACL